MILYKTAQEEDSVLEHQPLGHLSKYSIDGFSVSKEVLNKNSRLKNESSWGSISFRLKNRLKVCILMLGAPSSHAVNYDTCIW